MEEYPSDTELEGSPSTERSPSMKRRSEEEHESERAKRARTRENQGALRHLEHSQEQENEEDTETGTTTSSSVPIPQQSAGDSPTWITETTNDLPTEWRHPKENACSSTQGTLDIQEPFHTDNTDTTGGFDSGTYYRGSYGRNLPESEIPRRTSANQINGTPISSVPMPRIVNTLSAAPTSSRAINSTGDSSYRTRLSGEQTSSHTNAVPPGSNNRAPATGSNNGRSSTVSNRRGSTTERTGSPQAETEQNNNEDDNNDPLGEEDVSGDVQGVFDTLSFYVQYLSIGIRLPNDLSCRMSMMLPLFFIVYWLWLMRKRWFLWVLILVECREFSVMRAMTRFIVARSNGEPLRQPNLFYGALLFSFWRLTVGDGDDVELTSANFLWDNIALRTIHLCLWERLRTVHVVYFLNGCGALVPGKTSGIVAHEPGSGSRHVGTAKRLFFFTVMGLARLWVGYRTTIHWLHLFELPSKGVSKKLPVCPVEQILPFYQNDTCPIPSPGEYVGWQRLVLGIFGVTGELSPWGIAYLTYKLFWLALTALLLVVGIVKLVRASAMPPQGFQIRELSGAESCPICLDNIDQAVELNCGHQFCVECLQRWETTQSGGVTCPVCRTKIDLKGEIPSYLWSSDGTIDSLPYW